MRLDPASSASVRGEPAAAQTPPRLTSGVADADAAGNEVQGQRASVTCMPKTLWQPLGVPVVPHPPPPSPSAPARTTSLCARPLVLPLSRFFSSSRENLEQIGIGIESFNKSESSEERVFIYFFPFERGSRKGENIARTKQAGRRSDDDDDGEKLTQGS